ncbi:MAG: SIMPL domain-containing protein [Syntrophomonas sp.]|nr:SIMPL domain-containing protein [Syntrophomonas sp.]
MNDDPKKKWLWITAAILSLGLIISSLIISQGMVQLKSAGNTITVTGSAKQQIKSDWAVWTGSFSTHNIELPGAYAQIKSNQEKVKAYLIDKGILEQDMIFSSINTDIKYALLPNGLYSNQVESYYLRQQVEIRSKEVDKITVLSREATDLINQGVEFQSYPPQYFYTKLADLKIEMLSKATEDSMKRAEEIAKYANSHVGGLKAARMGVFQITPLYSNEISDYGVNDTSSLDKEITAVMNCEFQIK